MSYKYVSEAWMAAEWKLSIFCAFDRKRGEFSLLCQSFFENFPSPHWLKKLFHFKGKPTYFIRVYAKAEGYRSEAWLSWKSKLHFFFYPASYRRHPVAVRANKRVSDAHLGVALTGVCQTVFSPTLFLSLSLSRYLSVRSRRIRNKWDCSEKRPSSIVD